MKKALVLVFSNLKHDARVKRQVSWLRKTCQVTAVCFDAEDTPGVEVIRISQTKLNLPRKGLLALALLFRAYQPAYRLFHNYGSLKAKLTQGYDLIVANDIDTLPLAFELKGSAKIIFDAHEYAPRHFENNKVWKTFFQPFYLNLCNRYIHRTDGMLTVGKGLADEYATNFGVTPVIITNATRYVNIDPSEVKSNRIRLVHHGIVNPSRRLELMVDMMKHLDERFSLDMILMTSDYASARTKAYITSFRQKAEADPRIRILPPVKSDDVVNTINQYDIGVFLIPPVNFNYANTLPNKLFDFIQARLGIAIGPTPEMASIVSHYRNGVVANNFSPENLAEQLKTLTKEDVMRFKHQSAIAAKELNAEKNETVFNELLNKTL